MNKLVLLLFSIFTFQNCTNHKNISENEFNAQTWKDDKNACQNKRKTLLSSFKNIAFKLKGMSEPELRRLLGSPDEIGLYKRHQKFYIYFIEAAPKCSGNLDLKPQKIYIRFSAINNVNEITYRQ